MWSIIFTSSHSFTVVSVSSSVSCTSYLALSLGEAAEDCQRGELGNFWDSKRYRSAASLLVTSLKTENMTSCSAPGRIRTQDFLIQIGAWKEPIAEMSQNFQTTRFEWQLITAGKLCLPLNKSKGFIPCAPPPTLSVSSFSPMAVLLPKLKTLTAPASAPAPSSPADLDHDMIELVLSPLLKHKPEVNSAHWELAIM